MSTLERSTKTNANGTVVLARSDLIILISSFYYLLDRLMCKVLCAAILYSRVYTQCRRIYITIIVLIVAESQRRTTYHTAQPFAACVTELIAFALVRPRHHAWQHKHGSTSMAAQA